MGGGGGGSDFEKNSYGTHIVKNHESHSRSQGAKEWKCFGLYVTRQSVDRLQNSVLLLTEIKIESLYFKAQQRLNEICIIQQQP